eukprot:Hpha_TRINITY_DN15313_c2_g2::TRINITY_DN15313_c2_g2_i1::g.90140::m.90140
MSTPIKPRESSRKAMTPSRESTPTHPHAIKRKRATSGPRAPLATTPPNNSRPDLSPVHPGVRRPRLTTSMTKGHGTPAHDMTEGVSKCSSQTMQRVMEAEAKRLTNDCQNLRLKLETEIQQKNQKTAALHDREGELRLTRIKLANLEKRAKYEQRRRDRATALAASRVTPKEDQNVTKVRAMQKLLDNIQASKDADATQRETMAKELGARLEELEKLVNERNNELHRSADEAAALAEEREEIAKEHEKEMEGAAKLVAEHEKMRAEALQELQETRDSVSELDRRYKEVREENTRLRVQTAKSPQEVGTQVTELLCTVESMRRDADEQRFRLAAARDDVDAMRQSNDALRARLSGLETEYERRASTMNEEVSKLKAEREKLEGTMASAIAEHQSRLKAAYQSAKEANSENDARIASLLEEQEADRARIRQMSEASKAERASREELDKAVKRQREVHEEDRMERERLAAQLKEEQARLEKCREVEVEVQKELRETRRVASDLIRDSSAHEQRAAAAEAEVQRLHEMVAEFQGDCAGLQAQAAEAHARQRETDTARAESVKRAGQLQAELDKARTEAREAAKEAKDAEAQLTRDLVTARELEQALTAERAELSEKLAAAQEAARQKDAQIKAQEETAAETQRRLREVESNLKNAEFENSALVEEKGARGKARDQQIEKFRADATEARKRVHELESRVTELEDDLQEKTRRAEELQTTAADLESVQAKLRAALRDLAESREHAKKYQAGEAEQRDAATAGEARCEELDQQLVEMEYERDLAKHELQTVNQTLAQLRSRLEGREEKLQKVTTERDALVKQANESIDALNLEVQRLADTSNSYAEKHNALIRRLDEATKAPVSSPTKSPKAKRERTQE